LLQFFPPEWTAEQADRERMECYDRTLHEKDRELATSILVKCMQAKGFTIIMAYYPSRLTWEQSEGEKHECYNRGALDPDGLLAAVIISCLRDKGWNVGPRVP
jgi:hypothetical protein